MEVPVSPVQPPEQDWGFVEALQRPLWESVPRWSMRAPAEHEVDLSVGVQVFRDFPDPSGVLTTAFDDLERFFRSQGIPPGAGFGIRCVLLPRLGPECRRIEVTRSGCLLGASDSEGIRRAIFELEDEMRRERGPFLTLGTRERRPYIRTRISRCFFGPIKRPPRNRDELTDDVDYYPDEYLNRLAHEGVNALWLTAHFRDLCPSRFFPAHGQDRERRLAKLRRTVAQCARYGIRIYVFTIEPMGFGANANHLLPISSLEGAPWFAGHRSGGLSYFCTSTDEGIEYLETCTRFLFSSVPDLGGLIDINLGERPTHCYSAIGNFRNCNCPRCSTRDPAEVFRDTVGALARGMHEAAPTAEMISWLYVPQLTYGANSDMDATKRVLRDIAARMPETVTFQYNFESGGVGRQLGRQRMALDYFLSWAGPSDIFADCARNAVGAGARASAKIQVGCSHEIATIPFIPVPGLLYEKYKAMHEIGISTVMQCWYFGNYPGLMNKAAGLLSLDPFPDDRDAFLHTLALPDWGPHAAAAVKAWNLFHESYANFPINLTFTHYGPLHHAVVWPLHLFPVDEPIAPSWKFTFPLESGDRIGECICYDHTLEEVLVLLRRMADLWEKGVQVLDELSEAFADDHARLQDIGLAKAIGLQIRSALNVFTFYSLREGLPDCGAPEQLAVLGRMTDVVQDEIATCARLSALCKTDSRLGFHSEAEGYKYFPAKLEWRSDLLRQLLENDFPVLREQIQRGEAIFAGYTGAVPEGPCYRCADTREHAGWEDLTGIETRWRSWNSDGALCMEILCREPAGNSDASRESVTLEIEPCRLWPVLRFTVFCNGAGTFHNRRPFADDRWAWSVASGEGEWRAEIRIPWECFEGYRRDGHPVRINIFRQVPGSSGAIWIEKHPLESRLHFGNDNPRDLGWLIPAR